MKDRKSQWSMYDTGWPLRNLLSAMRVVVNPCSAYFWNIFLSLMVFGLLSSSLFLFPRRFGRYVLRPSSGVCRTREPTRNFKLRPLLNPRGSPVLIHLVQVLSIPVLLLACSQDWTCKLQMIVSIEAKGTTSITVTLCVLLNRVNFGDL